MTPDNPPPPPSRIRQRADDRVVIFNGREFLTVGKHLYGYCAACNSLVRVTGWRGSRHLCK